MTEPPVIETQTETVPSTEAPTEPDNRTEWQKKFADHFTDEVVVTENSYTSPQVSITVETVVEGEGKQKITYYVADIYMGADEFRAGFGNEQRAGAQKDSAMNIAKRYKAVVMITFPLTSVRAKMSKHMPSESSTSIKMMSAWCSSSSSQRTAPCTELSTPTTVRSSK